MEILDMEISSYMERISRHAHVAPPVYVVAYVYIDRLCHFHLHFIITSSNVYKLILTTTMLASKFVEDLDIHEILLNFNYRNSYFAKVRGLRREEMNKLEVDFLFLMGFKLQIEAVMNDFIQLKSLSNVYDCETMIEGPYVAAGCKRQNCVAAHPSSSNRRDDCISIGSGSSNINDSTISCGPGHGIRLERGGSEARVENIYVGSVLLVGTTNGVRIKTWQVSVLCSSLFKIVTVRCGHCTNLLSVNMCGLLLLAANLVYLWMAIWLRLNHFRKVRQ